MKQWCEVARRGRTRVENCPTSCCFFDRERLVLQRTNSAVAKSGEGAVATIIQGHVDRLDAVLRALKHYSLEWYDDEDSSAGTRTLMLSNNSSVVEIIVDLETGDVQTVEFSVCLPGDEEDVGYFSHSAEINSNLLDELRSSDGQAFTDKLERLFQRAALWQQDSGLAVVAARLSQDAGFSVGPGDAQVWGPCIEICTMPAVLSCVRGGEQGDTRVWSMVPPTVIDARDQTAGRTGSVVCTATLEVG